MLLAEKERKKLEAAQKKEERKKEREERKFQQEQLKLKKDQRMKCMFQCWDVLKDTVHLHTTASCADIHILKTLGIYIPQLAVHVCADVWLTLTLLNFVCNKQSLALVYTHEM